MRSRYVSRILFWGALMMFGIVESKAQGPDVNYSKFLHTSQRHASLGCNSCHQRTDNSPTPRFPGHSACTTCHLGQFTTPAIPMCQICHTETSGNKPPLRSFPNGFKESFNIKFDHFQHMNGTGKPQAGCNGCHGGLVNRGFGISIPANFRANHCYTCHRPDSKNPAGREIASCGMPPTRCLHTYKHEFSRLSFFVQSCQTWHARQTHLHRLP